MTVNRFASFEAEVGGQRYRDRILEIPSINRRLPEFFAGIQTPENSSLVLNNEDGFLNSLNIRRGIPVVLKEYFQDKDGAIETFTVYRGKIDYVNKGKRYEINLVSSDDDILLEQFPNYIVNTNDFPSAIDTGNAATWAVGEAKKVPLSLIEAFEDVSTSRFRYLVGLSDLTIENVYRDNLLLTEYSGTATAVTTTTITLPLSLAKHDNFYNDSFVTMSGQTRKIISYTASTRVATLESSWTATLGAFTIKEWRKNLITVSSKQMTEIEFAISQRDSSGSMFTRERVSADIFRTDTTLRIPANALNDISNYLPDFIIDSASLATAVSDINTIGNLFADGALVEQTELLNVVNDIALIGRLLVSFTDAGQIKLDVDSELDIVVYEGFDDTENVLSRSEVFRQIPLSQLNKNLSIQYRRLYNTNEYRLTTANHLINSEGRGVRTLQNNFIFNKITADKTCNYLAKRQNFFDNSISLSLGIEARELRLTDILSYKSDELSINANYQIFAESIANDTYNFEIGLFDTNIFNYIAGVLPSDPVTDNRADFRFTPPDAVTSSSVNWTSLILNTTVNAELSWTNPTDNFKEVLVEYKRDADSLYQVHGKVAGNMTTIAGLIPGQRYDFRFTSFNVFDLSGGVTPLDNQDAPGDTIAPATPSAPTLTQKLGTIYEASVNYTEPSDFDVYEWEFRNGSTVLHSQPIITKGKTAEYTYKGSSILSITARVRAFDFAKTGGGSAYSANSNAISTRSIIQGDILNGEITENASSYIATLTNLAVGGTVVSVTITARNMPVIINFSCSCRDTGGGQIASTIDIYRGASTLIGNAFCAVSSGAQAHSGEASVTLIDTSPGSGSVTYRAEVGAEFAATQYSHRSIRVSEHRR